MPFNQELEERIAQRTAALQESEFRLQEAQRQLIAESSNRLKVALNAARMGMWDWDLVSGEIQWSLEHELLFGLSAGQFDGRYETFDSCLFPDDRDGLNHVVTQSLNNRTPYHHEFRVIWPDGSIHWIEGRGQAFYDEMGQPVRMSGTVMDIDVRKQAELALQERETLLRLFAQYAPTGIAMFDREMRYVMASQRWIDDYHPDDNHSFIGRSHYEVVPGVPDRWRQVHQRCLAGATERSDEDRFSKADGTWQWTRWEVRPWYTAGHEIGGIIVFSENISERKQAELALQELNQSLEQKVEDRTQELAERNQQLAISNRELDRATRLKDEFLANMSHELRTPLNAILGMSEVLQEQLLGPLNEQQQQVVDTVERSGRHLLELINDILDLAKISSGKMELDPTTVSAETLCSSSLVFVKQQAFQKGIQLKSEVPKGLSPILVDERRIRQVLINLLTNAVKFTLEGGQISLNVSIGYDKHWHGSAIIPDSLTTCQSLQIIFQVADTGIGISQSDLQHLFQPFVQINGSLNRQHTGTGLGLAMVKQITELHGGQVLVESQPGQGSCFTIALPYKSPHIDTIGGTTAAEQFSFQKSFPSDQPFLILLAEDNAVNISTFTTYLKFHNYQIINAKTGVEAVAMAKEQLPDLILMDIQMPEMDGLEAIHLIRMDERLKTVPIMALTALAMPGDQERCLQAGANQYLQKPIKLKQLLQVIEAFRRNGEL